MYCSNCGEWIRDTSAAKGQSAPLCERCKRTAIYKAKQYCRDHPTMEKDTNCTDCGTLICKACAFPLNETRVLCQKCMLKTGSAIPTSHNRFAESPPDNNSNTDETSPADIQSNTDEPSAADKKLKRDKIIRKQLTGVSGWLFFFALNLAVLGPLGFAFGFYVDWQFLTRAFRAFPFLKTLLLIYGAIHIPLILLSFSVGIGLISEWKKAIKAARIYLVVAFSFGIIASIFKFVLIEKIIGLNIRVPIDQLSQLLAGFLGTVLHYLVWASYLGKSKRVKYTFGLRGNR